METTGLQERRLYGSIQTWWQQVKSRRSADGWLWHTGRAALFFLGPMPEVNPGLILTLTCSW